MSKNSSFGALLLSMLVLFFGLVFKIAFKLRIGFALLYAFIATMFLGQWGDQNEFLATGIFFVLLAGGLISWVYTFVNWFRHRI